MTVEPARASSPQGVALNADATEPPMTSITVSIKNALPIALDRLWAWSAEAHVGTHGGLAVGETWTLSVGLEDGNDLFCVTGVDAEGELLDVKRAGPWPSADVHVDITGADYFQARW